MKKNQYELKVLPVKKAPEVESKVKSKLHPNLPGSTPSGGFKPFLMIITAPVRSGKSNLVISLIYNQYRDRFDDIIYISPTIANDDTGKAVMEDDKITKLTESLEDLDLILQSIVEIQKSKEKEDREDILVVLDDCLGLIKHQSYFTNLCSRYRHHRISLVVCVQSFKALHPVCRYNATAYIIFKTTNRKELSKMEDEFEGNFPFLELYAEATEQKYNFLYLNLETIKAYKNFDELLWQKP